VCDSTHAQAHMHKHARAFRTLALVDGDLA
jgi:hypothetical protein